MLTLLRLKELLEYDEATGDFVWLRRISRTPAGTIAGTIDHHGYRTIAIDRKLYAASRLAWLYVYGEWPQFEIDHINLDPLDNRIANLRIASKAQNCANVRVRSHNKLGIKGIYKFRNRYVAQITIARKKYHVGSFKTPEEAHQAYLARARAAFGDFSRGH